MSMMRHKQLRDAKMQITQEQIDELQSDAIHAELNCRFGWNTDVAGNSYSADGVSAAFEGALEILGLPRLPITEAMVAEHLSDVGEEISAYKLSDYSD